MGFMRGRFDHHPFHSRFEDDLHERYQRGCLDGDLRKMPLTDIVIPLHPVHGVVNVGDFPVRDLFKARPDFYWGIGVFTITQFLDGKHHLNKIHYLRDKKITKLLEKSGYKVLRHSYVRASKGFLKEVYVETRDVVNGLCETWDNMNGGTIY